jgi:hypothetical protein
LSAGLANLPLKNQGENSALVAAPTFGIAGFQVPDDSAGLDAAVRALHRNADVAIVAAQAQVEDAGMKALLRQMQQIDKKRYPSLIS